MRRASHEAVGEKSRRRSEKITRIQEEKDYALKRLMQLRHEVKGGRDSKCILIRKESGVRSRAMLGRRYEKNYPKEGGQGTDGCKKIIKPRRGRGDSS